MTLFLLCICFACVCILQQAIVPKSNTITTTITTTTTTKKNSDFDWSALKVRKKSERVWGGQLAQRKIKIVPGLGNVASRQLHLQSFIPLPSAGHCCVAQCSDPQVFQIYLLDLPHCCSLQNRLLSIPPQSRDSPLSKEALDSGKLRVKENEKIVSKICLYAFLKLISIGGHCWLHALINFPCLYLLTEHRRAEMHSANILCQVSLLLEWLNDIVMASDK